MSIKLTILIKYSWTVTKNDCEQRRKKSTNKRSRLCSACYASKKWPTDKTNNKQQTLRNIKWKLKLNISYFLVGLFGCFGFFDFVHIYFGSQIVVEFHVVCMCVVVFWPNLFYPHRTFQIVFIKFNSWD